MINFFAKIIIILLFSAQVYSHPMPQSIIEVAIIETEWQLTLKLPESRLQVALTQLAYKKSTQLNTARPKLTIDTVRKYVSERIAAKSVDGLAWDVEIILVVPPKSNHIWQVNVVMKPPLKANKRIVELNYGVILDEIVTHKASVVLVKKLAEILPENKYPLLGVLKGSRKKLVMEY